MRTAAVLVVVLVGCGLPRVDIAPLPARMTPVDRLAAFQRLRPTGVEIVEVLTSCNYRGQCNSSPRPVLELADGTLVRDPADLLPVLPPDGVAAKAARKVTRTRTRQRIVGVVMAAVVGTGLYVLGSGLARGDDTRITVGAAAATIGFFGGGFVMFAMGESKESDTKRAFAYYGPDLARKLDICVAGTALVPCESAAP